VYASVKGGRIPTEPELRLFLDKFSSGYEGGANVGFRNWHPIPYVYFCANNQRDNHFITELLPVEASTMGRVIMEGCGSGLPLSLTSMMVSCHLRCIRGKYERLSYNRLINTFHSGIPLISSMNPIKWWYVSCSSYFPNFLITFIRLEDHT
jgi:hypothetical protein